VSDDFKVELVRRRDLVRSVAALWKQNRQSFRFKNYSAEDEEIYQQLLALGDDPRSEDVDAIIGNRSWTAKLVCSKCEQKYDAVVRMVKDDSVMEICENCLRGMAALF